MSENKYTFESKHELPAQTSYFSIVSHIDNATAFKTAIIIDILRKYYKQLESAGLTTKVIVVKDYNDKVTFDALLLGIWYLFVKFYGEYPDPLLGTINSLHIGWNGPVDNPTIDIPLAIDLYESLTTPSFTKQKKQACLEAVAKYFYCNHPTLMGDYTSYNDLQTLDPNFYAHVESIYDNIEKQIAALEPSIITQERKWVFDVKPWALFYDGSYITTNKYELLKDVFMQATHEINNLTQSIEQDIYNYIHKVFPVSYYLYSAYMYRYYINIVVQFVKPYHATHLYMPASLYIGNNVTESVVVDEDYKRIIYKGLTDSVIHTLFDDDVEPPNYDFVGNLREDIGRLYTKQYKEQYLQNIYRSDVNDIQPYYVDTNFKFDSGNIQLDYFNKQANFVQILNEAFNIYNNKVYDEVVTSGASTKWLGYVKTLEGVELIPFSGHIANLTWYVDKVENNYTDDVLLILKYPLYIAATLDGIEFDCSNTVRFAFAQYRLSKWYYYDGSSWQIVDYNADDLHINDWATSDELTVDVMNDLLQSGSLYIIINLPTGAYFKSVTFKQQYQKLVYQCI